MVRSFTQWAKLVVPPQTSPIVLAERSCGPERVPIVLEFAPREQPHCGQGKKGLSRITGWHNVLGNNRALIFMLTAGLQDVPFGPVL